MATPTSTVNLDFEFVPQANIDKRLVEEAVSGLSGLPLAGEVRLVVTGQLKASYGERRRVDAEAFTDERITAGRVVAKAITGLQGSEILLDAVVVAANMETKREMSLARLVRHEGLHLLLRQRQEDAHSVRATVARGDETLTWMAALALEEYRIELYLCREGSFASRPHTAELPTLLDDYVAEFAALGGRWGAPDCATDALRMTNDLIVKIGLTAAEEVVRPSVTSALTQRASWQALVGPGWPAMRAAVATLPDAATSARDEGLEAVEHFVPVAADWCRRIGFEVLEADGDVDLQPISERHGNP